MRTARIGTLLALGLLGMLLVACGDTDVGIGTTTDTAAQRVDTTLAADPPTLIDALGALGVDVDAAPPAAVEPTGATFCGTADRRRVATGLRVPDETSGRAMRCFVDHAEADTDADLIEVFTTVEGDPIVVVRRTAAGTTTMFTDSTRDHFGSGTWHEQDCGETIFLAVVDTDPDRPEVAITCSSG
jgi:hypothetical protein